ncbi:glycosyltransferase family 2 protein [Tepidibacillus marianensis]|uniref:glycosyltransferase family 2 protein n=1 Tax=Tepidibacillus marianensis TaxID=3131995 RepID=UPI0030CDE5CB
MTSPFVSVIIPAYNEEEYIKKTIHTVMELPYHKEVIVINDGSVDHTEDILITLNQIYPEPELYLILLKKNQGKGQALARGIDKAKGDIFVFLDADLGDTIYYATKLIEPILESVCDMTIAIFPSVMKKSGYGLVKKLAQHGIYKFTGFKCLAPLSGQRAMKRQVLSAIKRLNNGFGVEVGLTIDALKRGYHLTEIEIPFSHRETGRDLSGIMHRGKEFFQVLFTLLLKWRMTE